MTKELRHPWQPQSREASSKLTYVHNPFHEHGIASENRSPICAIAKIFVERAHRSEIAGDNRNVEALAYWIGAVSALRAMGHGALAEDMAKLGVLEVAPRGFQAIFDLALA
jgi:hypothetical protein